MSVCPENEMMGSGSEAVSHYEVLGVSVLATAAEIKSAYRRLVKYHHPDSLLAKKDGAAAERIRQINAAYAVLKDPQARREYDRQLRASWASRHPQPTGSPLGDGQPGGYCPRSLDSAGLHSSEPSFGAFTVFSQAAVKCLSGRSF